MALYWISLELNMTVIQLPWSTANVDLVELFDNAGNVELAEVLFDGDRPKDVGIVQFARTEEAETAIGMLSLLSLLLVYSWLFFSCY